MIKFSKIIALVMLASLLLTACGTQASPTAMPPAATEAPAATAMPAATEAGTQAPAAGA